MNLILLSALLLAGAGDLLLVVGLREQLATRRMMARLGDSGRGGSDRKSTRLNSSHVRISYAVFCLKKKKMVHLHVTDTDRELLADPLRVSPTILPHLFD